MGMGAEKMFTREIFSDQSGSEGLGIEISVMTTGINRPIGMVRGMPCVLWVPRHALKTVLMKKGNTK